MYIGYIHGEFKVISEEYRKELISKYGVKRVETFFDIQCTKCDLVKRLQKSLIKHGKHKFCWCETLKEQRRLSQIKGCAKGRKGEGSAFSIEAESYMKFLRDQIKIAEERKKLIRV